MGAVTVSARSDFNREKQVDNWIRDHALNWMASLNNDELISEISIPGTHDSYSLYGGDLSCNQSKSVPDQLDMGIRILDVRCRRCPDCWAIHHGRVYQHKNFGEVLSDCLNFLYEHPTEFILMRITEEYIPMEGSKTNQELFELYLNQSPKDIWYLKKVIPRIGEVRGKIILLNQIDLDYGISWKDQIIEDHFDMTKQNIETKIGHIRRNLQIYQESQKNKLHFTFLSAAGWWIPDFPKYIAQETNKIVFEFTKIGRTGCVLFDFPGNEVIYEVIQSNMFKLDYDTFYRYKNILVGGQGGRSAGGFIGKYNERIEKIGFRTGADLDWLEFQSENNQGTIGDPNGGEFRGYIDIPQGITLIKLYTFKYYDTICVNGFVFETELEEKATIGRATGNEEIINLSFADLVGWTGRHGRRIDSLTLIFAERVQSDCTLLKQII